MELGINHVAAAHESAVDKGDINRQQRSDSSCELAQAWLTQLNLALAAKDPDAAARLFRRDGEWRDLVALTGVIHTEFGHSGVRDMFQNGVQQAFVGVRIDEAFIPARVVRCGEAVIEAVIRFHTNRGAGIGVVHLIETVGETSVLARRLLTTLDSLRDFEERIGKHRPSGEQYSRTFGSENWSDLRKREVAYTDREPTVLIIGAGQAGLTLGARLRAMGIDNLLVDPHHAVGDTWRERYHSLTLHNEIWVNHMPYIPFPPTWPMYTPKDMLGNWFEGYYKALELNVWTSTTFAHGTFEEATDRWKAELETPEGARTVRPRHIVMAVGLSGRPNVPQLPGLDRFAGDVVHSGSFNTAQAYRGKNCVVIGTGTSGHDAAQELYSAGAATVTLVQRDPTTVLSIDPSSRLLYSVYEEGHSTEQADLIMLASGSYPSTAKSHRAITDDYRILDAELVRQLNAVGYNTDYGPDGTGHLMKQLEQGGGFYINVGCAELIIERKIQVLNWSDIDSIGAQGLHLVTGALVPADLIVMATGYKSLQSAVEEFFGTEVAQKVGPIWGFGPDGELRNMWRPTPQRGLWIAGGSFLQCRAYSKVLAQEIALSGVEA